MNEIELSHNIVQVFSAFYPFVTIELKREKKTKRKKQRQQQQTLQQCVHQKLPLAKAQQQQSEIKYNIPNQLCG